MDADLKPRFIESLKRNNDQIREDRAIAIGEDSQLIYRRRVEDIALKIKKREVILLSFRILRKKQLLINSLLVNFFSVF